MPPVDDDELDVVPPDCPAAVVPDCPDGDVVVVPPD
jgi:hypothetical protein